MVVQISVVVCSLVFFICVRLSLNRFFPPPAAVVSSGRSDIIWRWYNVTVSWVHALLVTFGCSYCLFKDPGMLMDPNRCQVDFGTTLVTASTAYFVYDALDIVICLPLSQSAVLLCHHIVVISTFSLVIWNEVYVAISIVCLLVEVNSVFLHARQLLRMAKHVDSPIYIGNIFLNVLTFFLFRFVSLAWLFHWIWENRATIDQPYHAVLLISFPLMYAINIGLFMQVLLKDGPQVVTLVKALKISIPSPIRKSNDVDCHTNRRLPSCHDRAHLQ